MPEAATVRIPLSDIEPTPWKNGGGVTREIAVDTFDAASDHGWGWRFSIADVERDGPFSAFPGIDRVIAVIDGDGMDLDHPDGSVTALEPFQAVGLSGDDRLTGRLRSGPVRDMNIMTRRDRFKAVLEIWPGPRATISEVADRNCLLIHNLGGDCIVRAGDGTVYELEPAETLVHRGQETFDIQLANDARAAIIHIERI